MDYENFYREMAETLPDGCKIAEIGISNGRGILFLASVLQEMGKKFTIYGIDSMDYGGDHQLTDILMNVFRAGYADHGVIIIRKSSLDASCDFADGFFDLIFIDSSHEYDQTRAEIMLWTHKCREGGVVSGHDYYSQEHPGVQQAVKEMVPEEKLRIFETANGYGVWSFIK